ncbi:MAG: hypothetical protein QM487_13815 [Candidatus Marithrix sp.]
MSTVQEIRDNDSRQAYEDLLDESDMDLGNETLMHDSSFLNQKKDIISHDVVLDKNFDNDSPTHLPTSPSEYLLSRYMSTYERPGDIHIEVYNNWLINYAESNIRGRFLGMNDGTVIRFQELERLPPSEKVFKEVRKLTPQAARNQGKSYSSEWYARMVQYKSETSNEVIKRSEDKLYIGKIPVMLKSLDCILTGKNRQELSLLGEDPDDPGGYFIVYGAEKVVLLQEQLAVNKIFVIKPASKDNPEVHITANTSRGTALIRLIIGKKSQFIRIRLPSMKTVKGDKYKTINVLRIFRLLGLTTIEEIEEVISRFIPVENLQKSLYKLGRNIVNFFAVEDDVKYIIEGKMNKVGPDALSAEGQQKEINRILNTDLFPHLANLSGPDGETQADRDNRIRIAKINLLAIMVSKFLQYQAGFTKADDRDSWSNKRVEGAGRVMEQLFRNAWRSALDPIQTDIRTGNVSSINEISNKWGTHIYQTITENFETSFNTSNWGVKGYKTKSNVAQTLDRASLVELHSHLATVDVSISRKGRDDNLRKVQPSQYGFIDPVSTPESENCGLVKNLTVIAKASLSRSDQSIIRFLIGDTGKGLQRRVFDYENKGDLDTYLMVNGKFLGWCDGKGLKELMIKARRTGDPVLLPRDMSVVLEKDWLYIDLSPSRLMRPVLVVDPDTQELIIDQLQLREASFDQLFAAGAVELISSWEQETIKIAISPDAINDRLHKIDDAVSALNDVKGHLDTLKETDDEFQEVKDKYDNNLEVLQMESKKRIYTHCELDKQVILGPASILIPYANHNQAPRNTYQVSMGKQSLGNYNINHKNRFDGTVKLLSGPQRPMIENKMYEVYGLDERGPGENIVIAFMAYPYTEEDAFVVKKEFLDNSGFRIYKYFTYKTILTNDGSNIREYLERPELKKSDVGDPYKYLRPNGLPYIGAHLQQEDCVIGKIQYDSTSKEKRDESVYLRIGDHGIVEKVLVSNGHKGTTIKVKLRLVRVPQEGDKFAPRNAQKATCGIVESDRNMPFTAAGIVPDFIVNPTSFPSRMTSSYLLEMMAAKSGAYFGGRINGGSFSKFEFNKHRNTLKDYREFINAFDIDEEAFDRGQFGYEKMYSGNSGKPLEGFIYQGPCFFQALKHHVADKIQCRGDGAVKPVSHQPCRGRGIRGGLRCGEMERDSFISHGGTSVLQERLMTVSDGYTAVYCKECGEFARNNIGDSTYVCDYCEGKSVTGRYTAPYATKLLKYLLAAMNIGMNPIFIDSNEQNERIANEPKAPKQASVNDAIKQLMLNNISKKDIPVEAPREQPNI